MSWEFIFKLANLSVLPAWLLLMVAPRARFTEWTVHSAAYPFLLGLFYTFMLIITFGGEGGVDSLSNLKISFQRDEVLILGWVHYLVFDLFIGAWTVRDAYRNGIRHVFIIPSLILTLLAGPVGLLSYLIIRAIRCGKLTL